MNAWVHVEGWAGRGKYRVEVMGFTPKRCRVRVIEPWAMRRRPSNRPGDVVLVPRTAVRDQEGKALRAEGLPWVVAQALFLALAARGLAEIHLLVYHAHLNSRGISLPKQA